MYLCDYDDVFIDDAERRTIAQHLASLTARGRVAEEDGRYRLAA